MIKSFESIWDNCLAVIKDNVSIQAFKTWFEPIKPVKLKSNILTIQVPSQFFYEWLEEHYVDLLKKTIRKEIGSEAKLEYSIVMENNSGNKNPYTIKIPTTDNSILKNRQVSMPVDIGNNTIRNPFVIPCLSSNIRISTCLIKTNTSYLFFIIIPVSSDFLIFQ